MRNHLHHLLHAAIGVALQWLMFKIVLIASRVCQTDTLRLTGKLSLKMRLTFTLQKDLGVVGWCDYPG